MRKIFALVTAVMTVACLSGCSVTGWNLSTSSGQSIQFQNRTDELVGQVDTKLDPHSTQGVDYTRIPVQTASGETKMLNAHAHPILFVAYWCPHCQRTLQLLSKESEKLRQKPILVCVGYPKGTSLQQAVKVEQQEQARLHLAKFPVYYNLHPNAGDTYAPLGYPTLVYSSSSKLLSLYGEHTASIWLAVLSSSS